MVAFPMVQSVSDMAALQVSGEKSVIIRRSRAVFERRLELYLSAYAVRYHEYNFSNEERVCEVS